MFHTCNSKAYIFTLFYVDSLSSFLFKLSSMTICLLLFASTSKFCSWAFLIFSTSKVFTSFQNHCHLLVWENYQWHVHLYVKRAHTKYRVVSLKKTRRAEFMYVLDVVLYQISTKSKCIHAPADGRVSMQNKWMFYLLGRWLEKM